MLIPDYHLRFTFGYQIRFQSVSSGIKNVQKFRVLLGFLKRAWAGLRVENHDPVRTLCFYFPNSAGRTPNKQFCFLSRRPFGYYLPTARYGTTFAAKWSSNGGLEGVVSK